jgi:hypothetical protein
LALRGYHRGRPSRELEQGFAGIGRALTLSAFVVVVAWKLGGEGLYEHAQAGTALTTHADDTWRFALGLLLIPPLVGYLAGEAVDFAARRGAVLRERAQSWDSRGARVLAPLIVRTTQRMLAEGPTTWDRTWSDIRRREPLVYARITTKGGREIVGTVARESRIAVSPQPRDLFIEEVLRHPAAGDESLFPTRFGRGMFIQGSEIESVEFLSKDAIFRTAAQ